MQVYSDSQVAVQFLNEDCCNSHACMALVDSTHAVHNNLGEIKWMHVLREANQVADILAKHGLSMENQICCLISLLVLFLLR